MMKPESPAKLKTTLACFLAVFLCFNSFLTTAAHGERDYGLERIRSCDDKTGAAEGFKTSDFGAKESQFDLGNSSCLGWAIGIYAQTKIAIAAMNGFCGSGSPFPRVIPSPVQDLVDIGKATKKAFSNNQCRQGVAGGLLSYVGTMGAFGILLATAESYYKSTSLCGDGWFKPNPQTFLIDDAYNGSDENLKSESAKRKADVENWIANSNRDKLRLEPSDRNSEDSRKDAKKYREFYYGGIEFESDRCIDPVTKTFQRYYFRGTAQANYRCEIYNPAYRDQTQMGVSEKDKYKKAYECCLDTSQNYICLSKNSNRIIGNADHIFCKAGETCELDRPKAANETSAKIQDSTDPLGIVPNYDTTTAGLVKFEAYFVDNKRMICARSYSLCPYNFSISGGSTNAEYYVDGKFENGSFTNFDTKSTDFKTTSSGISNCDTTKSDIRNSDCTFNQKSGKLKNYCQFYRHCTVVAEKKYFPNFANMNPYFSRACLDFRGDAKNGFGFNGIPQLGTMVNFSAPLAQCFKETLENVFFNRYGHSVCANGTIPFNDKCETSVFNTEGTEEKIENYLLSGAGKAFKKGELVNEQSFFAKTQLRMRQIVKMALMFSLMFLGYGILAGKVKLQKKAILIYLLKFGAVVYFALGNAWQDGFFDGVYGMSSKISETLFKVRVDDSPERRDGCQFGTVYNQQGSASTSNSYPKGREYLMPFDTLDCKLMKYLGYGPSTSASSVTTLIIAFFFTGGIGLYFAMSILIFAMMFIALIIRAIQLFISVGIAIIIYVFVSPIIIPLILFERTKSIFEAWLTQLIGFCFQPLILFAYLGIFITLMEHSMIGSAHYYKPSPESYSKELNCSSYCVNKNDPQNKEVACNSASSLQKQVNPMDDSMACILNLNQFGKSPGFEMFGVSFPVINNFFDTHIEGGKVKTTFLEVRMLTVLKCALLIFILAKFMDEIPAITSQLISSALPTSDSNSKEMFDKTFNLAANVQKRLARATRAGASYLGKKAYDGAKSSADKGETSPTKESGGGDFSANSNQSGGDFTAR